MFLVPLFLVYRAAAYRGLSVPGEDCNFTPSSKSREMPDAPFSPQILPPLLIAARAVRPFCPLAMPLFYRCFGLAVAIQCL